jgi:hypothetical protein
MGNDANKQPEVDAAGKEPDLALVTGRRGAGRPPGVPNKVAFSCWMRGNALQIRRQYTMYRNEELLLAALYALEVIKGSTRALCFHEACQHLKGMGIIMHDDLPIVQRLRAQAGTDEMVDQSTPLPAQGVGLAVATG